MKNSNKRLQLLSLYGIVGLMIYVFSNGQVLGVTNSTSKHERLAKDYPGLVRSSLAHVNLIQRDGRVAKPLLDFLALYNIKHDGTVKSINAAMQEHFMRKPGLERWHLKDTEQDKRLRPSALKLLRRMDLVDAIPHFQVDTDYFLLFGAKLFSVEKRFKDFLVQYNAGTLRCKNIVFLGGVRKLEPDEIQEMKRTLGKSYGDFLKGLNKKEMDLTELDMIRFVWQTKATTDLKRKYQEHKNLYFVNCIDVTDGTNRRPTATTTVQTWLREYIPTPGSCHANVEKPYGIRIEKILRFELEKYSRQLIDLKGGFSITWNSPASDSKLLLAVYKDELARTFLHEYNLKKYLGIIRD